MVISKEIIVEDFFNSFNRKFTLSERINHSWKSFKSDGTIEKILRSKWVRVKIKRA